MRKRSKRVAKPKFKYAVRFVYDGQVFDYVGKTPSELTTELCRVRAAYDTALRLARPFSRSPNLVLHAVRTQLEVARLVYIPGDPQQQANELARLNWVLNDCLGLLDSVHLIGGDDIRRLRFTLTYGQTPLRRDFDNEKPANETIIDNGHSSIG